MMHVNSLCVLYLFVFLTGASSNETPPVVTTSQGRIIGKTVEFSPIDPALRRSVDAYLGIPYAEAPVGPLRFKPPVAKLWSGELQATKLGNSCPQPLLLFGNVTMSGNLDENCLFLDVFVPKPVPPEAAVLVHIHGGGYMAGAGTMEELLWPTPTAAIGDVIVVGLNYRLGALGFLSTGDDIISGNMGLLDQRLALQWVRDNIRAFGGNPERVAIFGASAGGSSVGLHMVSPGSAGLFRGTILQSGDAAAPWATMSPSTARRQAFVLGKLVGCDSQSSEELLECLLKVDGFDSFLENQGHQDLQEETGMMTFTPVIDGEVIPASPDDLYAKGAINDAVSIIGALADEGTIMVALSFPNHTHEAPFVDGDTFERLVKYSLDLMNGYKPIVLEAVKMMYTNASCRDASNCDYLQSLSQVIGDVMFVCSGRKTAKAFTKAGRTVYHYQMTHTATTTLMGRKWTKAAHGDDYMFVFGMPLIPSSNWSFSEDEARMSEQIIKYWANLAKTGNPNLSSLDGEQREEEKLPEWPLFTLEELTYKDLSLSMGNGRGIKAKECLMWNEFIPKLVKIADEAKNCQGANDVRETENDRDEEQGVCTKETCPEE
ncbi:cholinesterase 1-like [Acanthaster planci]|uniref:Carboxylic ester hydrolase n=1 Tax=Acanthaster planci TaxID=133434 RepID=A0A8B7Z307_ACAPL|nr:cholinesterase 1-like [Acanthaster planci]